MNIKMFGKKVLLAENKSEVKSAAGIILDDAASVSDSKTATVLVVGSDCTEVQAGNKVLVNWQKGKIVKIDDAQRIVVEEEDILAVLE